MILRLINENLDALKELTDPEQQDKLMKVNNQLIDHKREIFARTGTVIRK
jgi:hypothetical protein